MVIMWIWVWDGSLEIKILGWGLVLHITIGDWDWILELGYVIAKPNWIMYHENWDQGLEFFLEIELWDLD